MEDVEWITEFLNEPEAAKYWEPYPVTEREVKEWIKKELETSREKHVIAELDGEPVGSVSVEAETGRCRHVAELGIFVRRKFWGKGVGSALIREATELAKQLGCRKLVLDTVEGNGRAIRLYKKFGFEVEAYQTDSVHFDSSWKKIYFMSLQLAPCEPKTSQKSIAQSSTWDIGFQKNSNANISIRQLIDCDLDELHRLQNCPESTKSGKKVPPVTKEETKRWYEKLKSREGKYCFACFENEMLLGYLRFGAGRPPYSNLWFEEIVVDVNRRPAKVADALIDAIKSFGERYGYHRIFACIPQTSTMIKTALENHGFKNTGARKSYYFIDGCYVDMMFYELIPIC
jgi:RimJ/RimL family protein N-acetyltransferase